MYPLQLGHNLYLKSGGVAFLIKSRVHRNRLWAWYSNKCMHHQGGHSSLLSRRRSNSPLVTVSFRTATSVQTVERCQYVSTWVFCRNYCTWHTLKEGRSLSILYWGISPLKIKAVKRHLDFEFSKIQKSKKIAIARSVPVKEKPRLQSISVDISAVEDDGDGGDISSRNTTPEKQVEIIDIISPPNTKTTSVQCADCGKFVSGPKALPKHQASKKCKNRAKGYKQFSCHKWGKKFNNRHDLERHRSSCSE